MINGKLFENMQKLRSRLQKKDAEDASSMYVGNEGITLYANQCSVYVPADEGSFCVNDEICSILPERGGNATIDIDVDTLKALLPLFSGTVRISLRYGSSGLEVRRFVIDALTSDRTQAVIRPVEYDSSKEGE